MVPRCRVTEITYELTGAYAGEKMARNGNRPVEIFVARAHPYLMSEGAQRTRKANR